MLGTEQFALMKPDAVLINTARGPIVNEAALIEALQSGQIAGAALDVFEKEPLSADSPLTSMDNVILTSHSIAWTEELFRDMGRIDCEGALAIYRGEVPTHVVNPAGASSIRDFIEKLARMQSCACGQRRGDDRHSPAPETRRAAAGTAGAGVLHSRPRARCSMPAGWIS